MTNEKSTLKTKASLTQEIEALAAKYLQKKALYNLMGKELAEMKAQINNYVNHSHAVFTDGELVLSTAVLKVVSNPPQIKTCGIPLERAERATLANELDAKYVVNDLNLGMMLKFGEKDKKLKQVLDGKDVTIEQETRIDIRRPKLTPTASE